jgi:hypothetical protein
MSISVKDLKQWLDSIPNSTQIGVDDGGLTLQVVGNPDVYLEVGGISDEKE